MKVSVPEDTTYEMAQLASGYNRETSILPLHGALIASAVAEEGVMPRPTLVDSICAPDGHCLYRSQPSAWKTAVSSGTVAQLRAMMQWVVDFESGTGRKNFRQLRRCAGSSELEFGGKTGSIKVDSIGNIEWFIGYAMRKDVPDSSLALAVVTAHGTLLTVHSSYLGAEIFRHVFCAPKRKKNPARTADKVRAPAAGHPS